MTKKAPGLLTILILSYPEVESWSLQAAPKSGRLPNPTRLPTEFIVTHLLIEEIPISFVTCTKENSYTSEKETSFTLSPALLHISLSPHLIPR